MTQITINVEDASMVPHLKKILGALKGVSISKSKTKNKTGIEEAYDDIKAGRIYHADSTDDLFNQVLGI